MKLWEPYDIPIVCIAGELGSGKTLWGLTVDPSTLSFDRPSSTFIWDTEGSSAPYVGALNFTRIDLPGVTKSSAEAVFLYWRDGMLEMRPDQYRVGIIDTVTLIEEGLAAYVYKHPSEFGYTANQFAKAAGLMWGAMKNEWKRLLMLASKKFETLVLTAHMRDEFKGSRPTNKRIPKGKETITQIASIFMTISRSVKPGTQSVQVKPSGICTWPYGKTRLVRVNPETNQLDPLLPPCIPDASPDGIREYLKEPPNFSNLKPSEQAPLEPEFTEEDKLVIKACIAEAESTKAQAELSRVEVEKELRKEVKMEVSMTELKKRLLTAMSIEEAKKLLITRYGVKLFVQLDGNQIQDLSDYLDTLPKPASGLDSSGH